MHHHLERPEPWWRLGLAGALAAAAEAAHWGALNAGWTAAPALLAIALCGLGTYRAGVTALLHGRLNINALMSIAVTGALALGQWPEAAMVMVLYNVAERLESQSIARVHTAIADLVRLAPDRANVLQADGAWQDVPTATVAIGARVRAAPGERIALDGTVEAGRSNIDQSPLTGESLPVDKGPGDPVYAGTINGDGSLEYRVTASADHSTLARIVHCVEAAQSMRAPSQRFVDRFARVYTPAVILLALAVSVLPPLVAGADWLVWAYRALVLLVIACPCALVIATPVTVVSGLTAAARRGILIKGGAYLEQGHRLRWLALDKTGTLTRGHPVLTDRQTLGSWNQARCDGLAAALAARSRHPVSRALVQGLGQQRTVDVDRFQAIAGHGVQGVVDEKTYTLGNHRLIHAGGHCSPALEAALAALERQGRTVVLLAGDQEVLALYSVADALRPESAAAVQQLVQRGIQPVLLSGDNPQTTAAVARALGIQQAHGGLLPADKLAAIEALMAPGGRVGMVGDGINDAPALARADIGFAMAAIGSDAAIEVADVAILDDDLGKIPWFTDLSRATHRILRQNIGLALGIKLAFLVLTLVGLGTMWMAVFADVGASLIVVANGLRLLRYPSAAAPGKLEPRGAAALPAAPGETPRAPAQRPKPKPS